MFIAVLGPRGETLGHHAGGVLGALPIAHGGDDRAGDGDQQGMADKQIGGIVRVFRGAAGAAQHIQPEGVLGLGGGFLRQFAVKPPQGIQVELENIRRVVGDDGAGYGVGGKDLVQGFVNAAGFLRFGVDVGQQLRGLALGQIPADDDAAGFGAVAGLDQPDEFQPVVGAVAEYQQRVAAGVVADGLGRGGGVGFVDAGFAGVGKSDVGRGDAVAPGDAMGIGRPVAAGGQGDAPVVRIEVQDFGEQIAEVVGAAAGVAVGKNLRDGAGDAGGVGVVGVGVVGIIGDVGGVGGQSRRSSLG